MLLAKQKTSEVGGVHRLIGHSESVRHLRERICTYAHSMLPVLIEGETGTGKELVARALHDESPRSAGPFVPVDCGALPESLAEAELFGHRRGAFTGAVVDRQGLVAVAEGGTLFLDEVENLSLALQAKLLRFLQTADYRPLGAARTVKARVRVLAASNVNLGELVAAGGFRLDLLFRLDVLRICLPPLRERTEDLVLIARDLLARGTPCTASVGSDIPGHEIVRHWASHSWPGNVRELINLVERARVFAPGLGWPAAWREVTAELSAERIGFGVPARVAAGGASECGHLESLLDRHRWQRASAARELGISRVTLWRRMRRLGLLPGALT